VCHVQFMQLVCQILFMIIVGGIRQGQLPTRSLSPVFFPGKILVLLKYSLVTFCKLLCVFDTLTK